MLNVLILCNILSNLASMILISVRQISADSSKSKRKNSSCRDENPCDYHFKFLLPNQKQLRLALTVIAFITVIYACDSSFIFQTSNLLTNSATSIPV
jgi:hypothetical protein